jgi:hypothetical protein
LVLAGEAVVLAGAVGELAAAEEDTEVRVQVGQKLAVGRRG